MADPYTITLTSAAENINNTPDTYQLILTFTVDASDDNEAYSFADKNLVITNHGITTLDLNFDDLLLVPGQMDFEISDKDDYLHDILYGTTAQALALEKDFKTVVKLNASDEFIGHAIENTLNYDMGKKLLKFKSASRTDILKETLVFDTDGLAQDPLGYTVDAADAISALTVAYDGNDAKMVVTHANGATAYQVADVVKISGVSATERSIEYINKSYTVTDVDDVTHLQVLSMGSFEEDVDLTFSFGTIVKVDIDNTKFVAFTTLLDDIYDEVNSASSVTVNHDWLINMGWTQAVEVTDAVHAGGTVTITHAENTSIGAQDADVAQDDIVVFQTDDGESMTDLNAEFAVTAANSATEFEISLTTAQTFDTGARVRKITNHALTNTAQIVDEAFHDNSNTGIETLADVLTALAIDWFAFTGMIHEEKAFFKKLNDYASGDLNTLGTVISHRKLHSMGSYSYVETEKDVSTVKKTYGTGNFTSLSNQILTRKAFASIIFSRETTIDGDNNYPHDFSDSSVTHTSSIAQLGVSVKDTSITLTDSAYYLWKPNLYYMSKLWFELLGQGSPYRREVFLVVGVGYDFLKGFEYSSGKYNIIGMKKNWNNGITEIDAIYLGAV